MDERPAAVFQLAVSFDVHRPRVLDRGRGDRRDLRGLLHSACSSTSASPGSRTSARSGSWRSAPTRWRSSPPSEGWNFWLCLPVAIAVAIGFGLIIGLPSLRLRADYFAIATIASAEMIRAVALNARDITSGAQGIYRLRRQLELDLRVDRGVHRRPRLDRRPRVTPVPRHLGPGRAHVRASRLISARPGGGCCGRCARTRTRPARWARTRSPTSSSRWRSRPTLGALAGWFLLAINLKSVDQDEFEPLVHLPRLRDPDARRAGELLGGGGRRDHHVDGARGDALPRPAAVGDKIAALRFILVGLVLIVLMAFRPQGVFGKREEMVLGE